MFVGWPGHLNNLNIIAPIGLSFLTFQAISYLIDIKREAIEPEKNFFHLTIYFLYFPKILAGPIERANTFLSQLKQPLKACPSTIKDGLKLCLLGFFKKLVIADRLTEYVNKVYDAPDYFSSQALIAATIFFTIQLYCDFSGYCDIGMGISKMLGIKLTKNFNHPFFAESFTDFWKRWHITLSSWLRDYVFLPLCGRRAKHIKIYRSIIIVFAISGLWHGANWTFIVWGLLHGVFIVIENIIKRIFKNHEFNLIPQQLVISLKIVLTFFLVTATRVFFRAKNIDEALYIFKRMFTIAGNFDFSEGRFLFFLAIIMLLIYEITAEYFSKKLISLSNNSRLLKLGFTVTIIALIILLGEFNGGRFIYARF
ncbi:MBOAT family protein [Solitalea sp. MAHUQ-68]|uniref:MBOAT family protein n=1 Tax=Solitalea agri TaxID=2953739 RepID=A0A9X2JE77_9SPHI|nr:MBOAT family O-acyltransferase [Solitalea agri]MCO4293665.1 MBOAT family protein [Solitalea agri]